MVTISFLRLASELELKSVDVVTPVTTIPFAFTFRTEEPADTKVILPNAGEKKPV